MDFYCDNTLTEQDGNCDIVLEALADTYDIFAIYFKNSISV